MTVYLDEVFLINLLMDWLILWAVGSLAQSQSRWWRLWLAALMGAIYAMAIFFPEMYWLTSWPVKIAWSLLMILLAYPFINWRNYLKLAIYFYLAAFVFGGASLACMYLFGQPVMQTWSGIALVEIDFQIFWLLIGAGFIFTAVYCLRGWLRQDLSKTKQIITASLQVGDKQIALKLLADSGHSLSDPLTGRSVLIAEQSPLLSLFAENVKQLLLQPDIMEMDRIVELTKQTNMAGRWRIIPYQVVGQQGLLLGFRLDQVTLYINNTTKTIPNMIVALSAHKFSSGGEYQGLVSFDVL